MPKRFTIIKANQLHRDKFAYAARSVIRSHVDFRIFFQCLLFAMRLLDLSTYSISIESPLYAHADVKMPFSQDTQYFQNIHAPSLQPFLNPLFVLMWL